VSPQYELSSYDLTDLNVSVLAPHYSTVFG